MKYDRSKQQGMILLASDHRKGLWANTLITTQSKPIRTGGQMSTATSAHTLQTVGLAAAMRSILNRDASTLAADAGLSKPRLLVTSEDEDFLASLSSLTNGRAPEKPLKTGKNFYTLLVGQLRRFDVDWVPLPEDDPTGLILKRWVQKTMPNPKYVSGIYPSVAGQVA